MTRANTPGPIEDGKSARGPATSPPRAPKPHPSKVFRAV